MKASPLPLLAAAVLFFAAGNNFACAQNALSPASFMAIKYRMLNVAPDTGQGAGSEVTGYRGCTKCDPDTGLARTKSAGTLEWHASGILDKAGGGNRREIARLLREGRLEDALAATGSNNEAGRLAVAEICMRSGQAEKAWPLIRDIDVAAAGLDEGAAAYSLWLKGLVAWTQGDFRPAYDSFAALAARKVPGPNRAAASYWAARAAEKLGRKADRQRHLGQAANYPRSFYGMLAMTQRGMPPDKEHDGARYPAMPWMPEKGLTDPALILAVARNESSFNSAAVSPKGATGVMQIMPATAELIEAGASKKLFDPALNVTLGDRYLDMLRRTDGIGDNLLFMIGSYNAGPKRILELYQRGRAQNGEDPLLFIETLPIKETRDYMQKVMASYWVYRARFDRPLVAMAELSDGRWPTYRPGDMKLTMNREAP